MKKNTLVIIFFLILALGLAILTRYYKLGQAPAGLYLDEAGQGYNAYSILKTGMDEYGKAFPVVFRSFIDFKTPVYIYLMVPLIPIFGLNPYTVRLPSFILSILTIPLLYLLIKELLLIEYKKGSIKEIIKSNIYLPLIPVILLAISPWHILFGRTNFECNVALFFYLVGVLLFYKSLKKAEYLIWSAIFFAIAIPAYHSQRVITPLTLIVLFIRYKDILLDKIHLKKLTIGLVIGFIILLPTLLVSTTPGFLARAVGLNIFSIKENSYFGFVNNYQSFFPILVNNPLFQTVKEFSSLYISYLTPRNMFLLGDSGPRSSFPDLATFYVWQFPFYIYGMYLLVKKRDLGELKFFTLLLLFISPIPAAVTRDPYSTIRALPLVIPQTIIIGLAIQSFITLVRKNYQKVLLALFSFFLLIYCLAKLYSSVIILNEYYRGYYWDYGWEKVVDVIKTMDQNLPVVVDNARFEPYSQILFFLKYDPVTYQKQNFEVSPKEYYSNMNRVRNKVIGNIATRPINWERDLLVEQYLIGDELSISTDQISKHNLTLISQIEYPNKNIAYRIVKTNPKCEVVILFQKTNRKPALQKDRQLP